MFEAFTDTRTRNRWLEAGTLRQRTAQPNRSARFDFRDGPEQGWLVSFVPKGDEKATVVISHERLADADAVEELRAFWGRRACRNWRESKS